jgi:hypothetical protein
MGSGRSEESILLAPAMTTAQTGRFTKNTQRHPGPCESRPPASTPMADASGIVPDQTPIALTRSVPPVNDVVRIDNAAGVIIAAPRPCASLEAISIPSLLDSPPTSEERPNSVVPAISRRRRPNRSAARPPRSRNPP